VSASAIGSLWVVWVVWGLSGPASRRYHTDARLLAPRASAVGGAPTAHAHRPEGLAEALGAGLQQLPPLHWRLGRVV